jgi:predicted glutamine amidotransferase
MCLLSYHGPGVKPDRDHLLNGARLNPDSFGWAIATGSRILVMRGFDAKAAIGKYMTAKAGFPDAPSMFHSRHSTDTESTLENAHPFPVGGSNLTVVAHNGWLFPHAMGDGRTDSRVFAEEMLPKYNLDSPIERRVLEDRMGANKAVVLSVSAKLNRMAYILNSQLGIWLDDGTWHSNADYCGTPDPGCRLCFAQDTPMMTVPSGSLICEDCWKQVHSSRALLAEGPSATAWR